MSGPQQLLVAHSASGGLWTMANLASPPEAWYNESSSVTGTTNASQWNDASGNGYHMIQPAGANQPAIIAAGLDGKRTIRFDGTNDFMAATSPSFANVNYGWLAMVFKRLSTDGSPTSRLAYYLSVGTTTGNTRLGLAFGDTGTANRVRALARRLDADASVGTLDGPTMSDTNWHIVLMRMEWANGDAYVYFDGGSPTSNLTITTSGATSNTAPSTPPRLGASTDGSSNPIAHCDMEVAELAVLSGIANIIPSDGDIDRIFGSLAWKWGIESVLPGGHPYASAPPTV